MDAIAAESTGAMCKGTKVDLWKLIVSPVAVEKASKMFFRDHIDAASPFAMIKVSSAY